MGKAERAAGLKRREEVRRIEAEAAEAFHRAMREPAIEPAPAPGPARRQVRQIEVEPGYPEDWRVRLGASADRVKRERERQDVIVAQAMAAGATWSAVAKQLGVTRQSAWKRFRHVVGVVDTPGRSS